MIRDYLRENLHARFNKFTVCLRAHVSDSEDTSCKFAVVSAESCTMFTQFSIKFRPSPSVRDTERCNSRRADLLTLREELKPDVPPQVSAELCGLFVSRKDILESFRHYCVQGNVESLHAVPVVGIGHVA